MQVQSIKVLLNQTWIREIWCSSWMEGLLSGRSIWTKELMVSLQNVALLHNDSSACGFNDVADISKCCMTLWQDPGNTTGQMRPAVFAENSYYWSLALYCDVMACEWIAVCVFDNFLSLPSLLSSFKISTFLYASLWFMPSGIADQWCSDAAPGTWMQSKATQALIHACQVALTCCPSLFGVQLTDVFTLGKRLHHHESLQSSKWFTMTLKSARLRREPW